MSCAVFILIGCFVFEKKFLPINSSHNGKNRFDHCLRAKIKE